MSTRSFSVAVVVAILALTPVLVQAQAQSTTYSLDLRFLATDANFFSFPVDDPLTQTQIGPVGGIGWATFAMDFNTAGTVLHVIDNAVSPSFQLGTIDFETTGGFTPGPMVTGPLAGQAHTGLAVDPTDETFYVSTGTQLFTIDPVTGVSTLVATFSGTDINGNLIGLMIDIAIDSTGQMFAHDIGTDALYAVNKATAAATFIGFSNLAANFAQGMDIDPATDVLYAAIYTGGGTGSYGTWDTSTGVFTEILTLPMFPDPTGNGRELEMAIRAADDMKKGCEFPLGDVNMDGIVSLQDVNPFVNLLTSGMFQCEADINEDGVVNLSDVNPFVTILTGG